MSTASFKPLTGAIVLVWAAAACSDGTGPGGGTPGISVVSGGTFTDTIGAFAPQPVVVEVRDASGAARAGVAVHFNGAPEGSGDYSLVLVATTPTSAFTPASSLQTDNRGRAAVFVRLGPRAGTANLRIDVHEFGLSTSVPFPIATGAVVQIAVMPKDTAVYVLHSYALRATALDRFANARDTSLTVSGGSATVAVSTAGVVTGLAVGRDSLTAHVGAITELIRVSIVPVGTIAAHARRRFVGDSIGIVVTGLDGSGYHRPIVETQPRHYDGEEPPRHEMPSRWLDDGSSLVHQESMAVLPGNYEGSDETRLFISTLGGAKQRLLPPALFAAEMHPDVSADGSWIYFAARRLGQAVPELWRIAVGSSAPEPLGAGVPIAGTRPAVSPDGEWLAFSSADSLHVLHIASGAVSPLALRGTSPRWSPDGSRIAYVDSFDFSGYSGALRLVNRDGSDDRLVLASSLYAPGIDWSPDGEYLIAESGTFGGLDVIRVTTGVRIPLPFTSLLGSPSWRR